MPLVRVAIQNKGTGNSLGVDAIEDELLAIERAQELVRGLHRANRGKLLAVPQQVSENFGEASLWNCDLFRATGERVDGPRLSPARTARAMKKLDDARAQQAGYGVEINRLREELVLAKQRDQQALSEAPRGRRGRPLSRKRSSSRRSSSATCDAKRP